MTESSREDLILCSATLLPDPTDPGPEGLAVQVEATRAAGFSGLSLWRLHAEAAATSLGSAEAVREMVLGSGLRVPIVEAMMPWDQLDYAAAKTDVEPFLELAEAYGAEHVLAVTMSTGRLEVASAGKRLREVCARAGDRGLGVVIEFLPWSGVPDLATALQIVESSEADNAGLLIDGWHWQRQPGGPCPDILRSIPPERIKIFQICDAAADSGADPIEECLVDRRLPGEGVVDLQALVEILDEMGARPILAPEVFNRSLAQRGAAGMAQEVLEATIRLLGEGRLIS